MSAKKTIAKSKTIYASAAGPMPLLRAATGTDKPEAKPTTPETTEAAKRLEASRAAILRLVETVKGL